MPPQQVTHASPTAGEREPALAEPQSEKQLNRAVYASTKYESTPSWTQALRGWAYVSWVMLCPFLDMVWIIIPTQLFVRSKLLLGVDAVWPQKLLQWLEETFFSQLGGLLELFGGMDVVVTTDDAATADKLKFPSDEQVLLICNHRTEIDWIFSGNVLPRTIHSGSLSRCCDRFNRNLSMRFNCHGRIRVMMKSIIRCLPGPGWAMLMLDYPYVNRKWETDQGRIKSQIARYKEAAVGFWLCMFPEGTALFQKTLERSHEFARKRGQKLWDYVLIPRVKGFELCANEMELDSVLDITVGYPELQDGVRPSPLRLVRGQFPTAVHIHINKYSKTEVAQHKNSMDTWLKERFQAKEDRLRKFYEDGAFHGHRVAHSETNIPLAVAKSLVFHSLLCAWTLATWYYYPLSSFLWFSFCMAVVVHRIQAFGE